MAKKKSEADSESKSKEKKKESDEPKSSVLRECPQCHLITRNKICPDCGAETEPVSTFFIPRSKARIPFEANDLLSTVAHEELNDVLQQYYLERAKAALAEAKLRRQETEAKLNTATATAPAHPPPVQEQQTQSQSHPKEEEKEKEGVFSWEAISLMPEDERERFLEYLAENPRAAALLSILNSKQYALAPALFLLNAAEQKKDGDSTSELIQAVSNFINNLQQNNNNQSISELINAIQEIQNLTRQNDGSLTESLLRHAIDKLASQKNDGNSEIQALREEIKEIKETLRQLTQPQPQQQQDAFSFLNNAINTLKKLKDSFADFYAPDWKERASFTHQLKLEEMERQRQLAKEEQDANRFKALATLFDLLHHRLQQQQQQQQQSSEEEQQEREEDEEAGVEVQGDLKHRVTVKVS